MNFGSLTERRVTQASLRALDGEIPRDVQSVLKERRQWD